MEYCGARARGGEWAGLRARGEAPARVSTRARERAQKKKTKIVEQCRCSGEALRRTCEGRRGQSLEEAPPREFA